VCIPVAGEAYTSCWEAVARHPRMLEKGHKKTIHNYGIILHLSVVNIA